MEATIAILLICGALLLALETVLPGLIAGMVGLGCLIAAIVLGFMHFGVKGGMTVVMIVGVGLILGTFAWFRFFPDSRFAKMFVSQRAVGNVEAEKPELLNQTGTALTTLRPSGMAMINGKRVDVVTEGAMIDKGAEIKVVALEGMRVVVRILEKA